MSDQLTFWKHSPMRPSGTAASHMSWSPCNGQQQICLGTEEGMMRGRQQLSLEQPEGASPHYVVHLP